MPVIRLAEEKIQEWMPDLNRLTLVSAALGASSLEAGELSIGHGKKVPMHIIEGPMEYTLGNESGVVNSGDVVLAPAAVKHALVNPGTEPRRLMFIFQTTKVERVFL